MASAMKGSAIRRSVHAESAADALAEYDFRGLPMGGSGTSWRQQLRARQKRSSRLLAYRLMVGTVFVVALVWICVRVDYPAVIMAPIWAAMIALMVGGIVGGFVRGP